jgi:hypothetical protein
MCRRGSGCSAVTALVTPRRRLPDMLTRTATWSAVMRRGCWSMMMSMPRRWPLLPTSGTPAKKRIPPSRSTITGFFRILHTCTAICSLPARYSSTFAVNQLPLSGCMPLLCCCLLLLPPLLLLLACLQSHSSNLACGVQHAADLASWRASSMTRHSGLSVAMPQPQKPQRKGKSPAEKPRALRMYTRSCAHRHTSTTFSEKIWEMSVRMCSTCEACDTAICTPQRQTGKSTAPNVQATVIGVLLACC